MPITSDLRPEGIRVITMEHPPVNALTVQGWFDLAAALDEASADLDTKVVILRAEGKGFNAGVDIKEMQQTTGFDALIGANRGCYAAFKAVYECAVPVVAAVNGHCLGGGVGLVGNADCIVASDDAYFGVPEVDRGALGAATHLARLVPPHLMRTLYFTGRTITATDLLPHGSVLEVVPRDRLDDAALKVAGEIAAKDGRVIRAAKEALNGIDPVDVNKSYRFEQGFTFELNLSGVSDELRDAFVDEQSVKGASDQGTPRQADDHRRGGRHARRRHHPRHRRLGSAAQADGAGPRDPPLRPQGPHPRQLGRRRRRPPGACRQGPQAGLRVRLARLGAARAELPEGPPGGHHPRGRRARRGDVPDRAPRRGAAAAVPADARRARLRRPGQQPVDQDRHQPVRRRRRSWSPYLPSSSTWRWCT